MVPQDITRIVWVSDPQISPDGARVAFVATTLSEERDEYLSNIWVVDADGGGAPRRFTAGPKRDRDPRWSPDGTRLAFVSEREGKKKGQLYVMPADGGEPTRLSDERHGVADPVWSPDGSRLAFVARVGGWHEPEREEDKQKSRPARVITTLKYRWNGEGFTYDRRRHVFVVAAAGGARAPAHRRRLGRRGPRVVARRADHRLQLGPPPGPRSRRQRRPLAGGRRRGRGAAGHRHAGPRGAPRVFARRAHPRVSRPALEERVRAERPRLHRGDRRRDAPVPHARARPLLRPARDAAASGRPTGGRSPSPPRTRARSGSIASGRRTARRRCG